MGASSTLEDAPTSFSSCGLTWVYAAYVIFQEGHRAFHNMIIQPGCAANASPKFGEVQADNENLELYFLNKGSYCTLFSQQGHEGRISPSSADLTKHVFSLVR